MSVLSINAAPSLDSLGRNHLRGLWHLDIQAEFMPVGLDETAPTPKLHPERPKDYDSRNTSLDPNVQMRLLPPLIATTVLSRMAGLARSNVRVFEPAVGRPLNDRDLLRRIINPRDKISEAALIQPQVDARVTVEFPSTSSAHQHVERILHVKDGLLDLMHGYFRPHKASRIGAHGRTDYSDQPLPGLFSTIVPRSGIEQGNPVTSLLQRGDTLAAVSWHNHFPDQLQFAILPILTKLGIVELNDSIKDVADALPVGTDYDELYVYEASKADNALPQVYREVIGA